MLEIIPKPSLCKWATMKYFEKRSTMELMASAANNHDITAIAIVALLEVEPATRYRGMREDEAIYIKSCHSYLENLVCELRAAGENATRKTC